MSLISYTMNTAWMLRCWPEWIQFLRATRQVEATQRAYLGKLVRQNQHTEYGTRFGFHRVQSIEEYQSNVPIMDEAEFESYSNRICTGESNVLTDEPVLLMQPTSGTIRGEKLIPYTRSLQREYQRMLAAWIGNLFRSTPAIRTGTAYWSISPATATRLRTPGGIPIGFNDDTAYLGIVEQWMASSVLAVPSSVTRESTIERFRYLTLLHLLRANDLALISIWSPTFLSALLDLLPQFAESLVRDIHQGTIRGELPCRSQRMWHKANSQRAREITRVLERNSSQPLLCQELWPQLALISCWLDGGSRLFGERLISQCSGIPFQGKGLLATEACVSFPIVGTKDCALAVCSHFFEFYRADSAGGRVLLAHELNIGECYSVIVTTGGGLYRYPLHDLVEVTGKLNQCPLVRFVGRDNQTSDMVGEKLHEAFVRDCINAAIKHCQLACSYAVLVPMSNTAPPVNAIAQYQLRVEIADSDWNAAFLAYVLDEKLRTNNHYAYARDLAQLGPVLVERLPGPPGSAWREYESMLISKGKLLGATKPSAIAPSQ
jgi:GH3 auxin-responsive promoter